jgi:hypothetical protein
MVLQSRGRTFRSGGRIKFGHVPVWVLERGKSKLRVQAVRVSRGQYPTAQSLQVWMLENGLDKPFAQAVTLVRFEDEDIGQISECRVIADDPSESDTPKHKECSSDL